MRKAALIGAIAVALSAAPAMAFDLFGDVFGPDVRYVHPVRAPHYYGRHYRAAPRSYMIAPGLVQTPVGPFVYDDVLDEWNHWTD